MYDFYYSRLLDDPSKFEPRAGNRSLEVFEPDGSEDPVLLERQVAETQIGDWITGESLITGKAHLDDQRRRRVRLRVLIGSPEHHQSDAEILPLPVSRGTFETLRTTWNLPQELLRMMLSTLPITTEFNTVNCSGQAVTGLMIRSARSRDWNFCLGLAYDEEAGSTSAILNGMQAEEVDLLIKCLRESARHLFDPMLLAIFLLELKVHYFAVLLEKRAGGIEEIELSTGMRHGFSSNARRKGARHREREKLLKEVNFDEITQKLTGVTGTLSFCDMTFASSLRALEQICKIRERLRHLQNHWQDGITGTGANLIDTRIAYLRELIVGAQAHGGVLSARTRAQVQTVYSMIGQKDNQLNVETAAASRKIAEIGLRHNTAMKDMAEDSRNIAILTRKDSTDMRSIAVVTLLFLPGTFMATLFSADFFNFLPADSNQVVSKWIWLYFLLTGATTVLVFISWHVSSKRQNKQVLTAMNADTSLSTPSGNHLESDHETGIAAALNPAPMFSSLWTARSGSTGEMGPYSSFGSSPEALKETSK